MYRKETAIKVPFYTAEDNIGGGVKLSVVFINVPSLKNAVQTAYINFRLNPSQWSTIFSTIDGQSVPIYAVKGGTAPGITAKQALEFVEQLHASVISVLPTVVMADDQPSAMKDIIATMLHLFNRTTSGTGGSSTGSKPPETKYKPPVPPVPPWGESSGSGQRGSITSCDKSLYEDQHMNLLCGQIHVNFLHELSARAKQEGKSNNRPRFEMRLGEPPASLSDTIAFLSLKFIGDHIPHLLKWEEYKRAHPECRTLEAFQAAYNMQEPVDEDDEPLKGFFKPEVYALLGNVYWQAALMPEDAKLPLVISQVVNIAEGHWSPMIMDTEVRRIYFWDPLDSRPWDEKQDTPRSRLYNAAVTFASRLNKYKPWSKVRRSASTARSAGEAKDEWHSDWTCEIRRRQIQNDGWSCGPLTFMGIYHYWHWVQDGRRPHYDNLWNDSKENSDQIPIIPNARGSSGNKFFYNLTTGKKTSERQSHNVNASCILRASYDEMLRPLMVYAILLSNARDDIALKQARWGLPGQRTPQMEAEITKKYNELLEDQRKRQVSYGSQTSAFKFDLSPVDIFNRPDLIKQPSAQSSSSTSSKQQRRMSFDLSL